MTGDQAATLSTIAWLVGTTVLFALLARWSDGGSWGITTAVTRGLVGWTGRNGAIAGDWPTADEWPSAGQEPAIDAPGPDPLSRARSNPASTATPALGAGSNSPPIAELEDLGVQHLP